MYKLLNHVHLQTVLDKIEQLFAQSLDCLAKVKVDETKKAELKAFADKLLKRNK